MNTADEILYQAQQQIAQDNLRDAIERQEKALRYLIFSLKGLNNEYREEKE